MKLADLLDKRQVLANLQAKDKLQVLDELASLLAEGDSGITFDDVCRTLVERERLRSTGVGSGVAVPHAKVPGLNKLTMALGLSKQGVSFDAADGEPVHIFMALAAPVSCTGAHLKALARIARLCGDEGFRRRLIQCDSNEDAYSILVREDEKQN